MAEDISLGDLTGGFKSGDFAPPVLTGKSDWLASVRQATLDRGRLSGALEALKQAPAAAGDVARTATEFGVLGDINDFFLVTSGYSPLDQQKSNDRLVGSTAGMAPMAALGVVGILGAGTVNAANLTPFTAAVVDPIQRAQRNQTITDIPQAYTMTEKGGLGARLTGQKTRTQFWTVDGNVHTPGRLEEVTKTPGLMADPIMGDSPWALSDRFNQIWAFKDAETDVTFDRLARSIAIGNVEPVGHANRVDFLTGLGHRLAQEPHFAGANTDLNLSYTDGPALSAAAWDIARIERLRELPTISEATRSGQFERGVFDDSATEFLDLYDRMLAGDLTADSPEYQTLMDDIVSLSGTLGMEYSPTMVLDPGHRIVSVDRSPTGWNVTTGYTVGEFSAGSWDDLPATAKKVFKKEYGKDVHTHLRDVDVLDPRKLDPHGWNQEALIPYMASSLMSLLDQHTGGLPDLEAVKLHAQWYLRTERLMHHLAVGMVDREYRDLTGGAKKAKSAEKQTRLAAATAKMSANVQWEQDNLPATMILAANPDAPGMNKGIRQALIDGDIDHLPTYYEQNFKDYLAQPGLKEDLTRIPPPTSDMQGYQQTQGANKGQRTRHSIMADDVRQAARLVDGQDRPFTTERDLLNYEGFDPNDIQSNTVYTPDGPIDAQSYGQTKRPTDKAYLKLTGTLDQNSLIELVPVDQGGSRKWFLKNDLSGDKMRHFTINVGSPSDNPFAYTVDRWETRAAWGWRGPFTDNAADSRSYNIHTTAHMLAAMHAGLDETPYQKQSVGWELIRQVEDVTRGRNATYHNGVAEHMQHRRAGTPLYAYSAGMSDTDIVPFPDSFALPDKLKAGAGTIAANTIFVRRGADGQGLFAVDNPANRQLLSELSPTDIRVSDDHVMWMRRSVERVTSVADRSDRLLTGEAPVTRSVVDEFTADQIIAAERFPRHIAVNVSPERTATVLADLDELAKQYGAAGVWAAVDVPHVRKTLVDGQVQSQQRQQLVFWTDDAADWTTMAQALYAKDEDGTNLARIFETDQPEITFASNEAYPADILVSRTGEDFVDARAELFADGTRTGVTYTTDTSAGTDLHARTIVVPQYMADSMPAPGELPIPGVDGRFNEEGLPIYDIGDNARVSDFAYGTLSTFMDGRPARLVQGRRRDVLDMQIERPVSDPVAAPDDAVIYNPGDPVENPDAPFVLRAAPGQYQLMQFGDDGYQTLATARAAGDKPHSLDAVDPDHGKTLAEAMAADGVVIDADAPTEFIDLYPQLAEWTTQRPEQFGLVVADPAASGSVVTEITFDGEQLRQIMEGQLLGTPHDPSYIVTGTIRRKGGGYAAVELDTGGSQPLFVRAKQSLVQAGVPADVIQMKAPEVAPDVLQ